MGCEMHRFVLNGSNGRCKVPARWQKHGVINFAVYVFLLDRESVCIFKGNDLMTIPKVSSRVRHYVIVIGVDECIFP